MLLGRSTAGLVMAAGLLMSWVGFGQATPDEAPRPLPSPANLMEKPAPEWKVGDWMNSDPLKLKDLRGKVVLVRWWTGPGCPYCSASAPALNGFHETYSDSGLVVVGFYHHKSRTPVDKAAVKKLVDTLGFSFPVAIDHGWKTLQEWWLRHTDSKWTSVTFLLDREGHIRAIHPGGQYIPGDEDHQALVTRIEALLGNPPPDSRP